MIPYQNCEIFASVLFFVVTKLLAVTFPHFQRSMSTLDCIPENTEKDEKQKKWVDKKKHDLLKVKYKCLKKLFQVYDATMISYIPEMTPTADQTKHIRRKHSHNRKTDASVDTTELEHGVNESTDITMSSTISNDITSIIHVEHSSQKTNKKPTRFQNFVHKVFGLKIEDICPLSKVHSESTIFRNKRRRKPLRFGRSRRINVNRKISEDKSPTILTYIQSVQKTCLMDTTPRQCPFAACDMKLYGIINYNDHLNLCHFPLKKHSCTYCHEGFEVNSEKYDHEDGHIGINKLNQTESPNNTKINKIDTRASITQTDSEILFPEKCKKVSFADTPTTRISRDKVKNHQSESILRKSSSKQFLSIFRKKRSEFILSQSKSTSNEAIKTDSETLTMDSKKLNSDSPKGSLPSNSFDISNKVPKVKQKSPKNSETISTSNSSNRTLRNYFQDKTYKNFKSRSDTEKEDNNVKQNLDQEIPIKLVSHPEEYRVHWNKSVDETSSKIKYIPAVIEWSSDDTSNLRNTGTVTNYVHSSDKTGNLQWKPNKAARITNDRPMSGCTLKCSICYQPFDHRSQLSSHYNTEHRTKKITSHCTNGKTKKSSLEYLNREEGKILIESIDNIDSKRKANSSARDFDNSNDACTNIVYESTSEAENKKVQELNRLSSKQSGKWVRSPNDDKD